MVRRRDVHARDPAVEDSMQFVIDEAEDGYFWLLKGGNGKVICVSEHVDSRQACLDTIAAIREGAAEAVTVDNTLQH